MLLTLVACTLTRECVWVGVCVPSNVVSETIRTRRDLRLLLAADVSPVQEQMQGHMPDGGE